METLPQCDFFLFFVSGQREKKKKKGKREKLHSLKGDEDTYMAKELPKNLKNKLENIVRETYCGDVWEDCSQVLFFKKILHNEEIFQGVAVTFTFTPSFSKA